MFLFLPAVNQLISCHVDMVPGRKGPVKGGGGGGDFNPIEYSYHGSSLERPC